MHDDVEDHNRAVSSEAKSISVSEKSVEIIMPNTFDEKAEANERLSRRSCTELLLILSWPALNPAIRRLRQYLLQLSWPPAIIKRTHTKEKEVAIPTASKTLLRMAATRRIVTSLGRLLSSKGEVIAQIRKRMHMPSPEVTNAGLALKALDGDIEIYMGDIQGNYMITIIFIMAV